jgi:hypothetical protein
MPENIDVIAHEAIDGKLSVVFALAREHCFSAPAFLVVSLSLFLSRRASARIVYFCADQNFWRFLQKGEKRKKKDQIPFSRTPLLRAHISPILLHIITALVVNVCIHNDVCKRALSTLEQHPAQPRTGERFTREIRTRCRYV